MENEYFFHDTERNFLRAIMDKSEDEIERYGNELMAMTNNLCLMDIDVLCNRMLNIINEGYGVASKAANMIADMCRNCLIQYGNAIRFFQALFAGDKDPFLYRKLFQEACEHANDDFEIYLDQLLTEFGMCAIPDVILFGRKHPETKAYWIIEKQLNSLWSITCYNLHAEGLDNELFKNIALGYLSECFDYFENIPTYIFEATTPHFDQIVEQDIKMLTESYSGEELTEKLNAYNERQMDVVGAYHIMANIMQEGSMGMESYLYCMDMFETIEDRCERETNFKELIEAAYRQTGKRPRYIQNTYNLGEDPTEIKKDDDWINPPDEDDHAKTKKIDPVDIPDEDDKKKQGTRSENGIVYNITYQNSFNKKSSVKDSYHHNRTNSDDNISVGGDGGTGSINMGRTPAEWAKYRPHQKKVIASFSKKEPLSEPPADLKRAYLNAIAWRDDQKKRFPAWVILPDTMKDRPKEDIQYRKYLAKVIEDIADDRDIDYDGSIVVAGDPTEGIYDIELTQFNDAATVEQLRKAANAAIKRELKSFKQKSNTGNRTLDEAIEYLSQFQEDEILVEEIKGGDPEKDRPMGQRIQNSIQDFNRKQQTRLNAVDKGLRTGKNIVTSAFQVPNQLISVVKNFISDINNRKEQELKEDILKDKKFRMRFYSLARSLVKTAIPWVVAGPLWGTLFNMVALPIRGVKSIVNGVKGGPYRDLTIEMREELRIEMQIIDDMISKAKTDQEKHKLMRERSRMEQEYFKIASKIHFDPIANAHRKRGEANY